MRVHLLGLPHTETTKAYSWCAFTEKTRKLANMLYDAGYDVRLYAGQENEARVTEHVPVVDRAWQHDHFEHYDWKRDVFNDFDPTKPHWEDFNRRCVSAIGERAEPGDVLGITMGTSQRPVAENLEHLMPVEVGIGYSGVWAPYRVFESYAWRHHIAGLTRDDNVHFYDEVIPNSFEPEDFPLGAGDGGYYLFMGRFIRRKGVQIAAEATEAIGATLLMAGQGVVRAGNTFSGVDVEVSGAHMEHVGVVGPAERAKLLGEAIAVFTPSTYLEPFCGVHVEAMMCGTPVITTDWGVFPETVRQGETGFRCSTLSEFVEAARAAPALDRAAIRGYALSRFTTDVVSHRYDQYLRRLRTLYGKGWYEVDDG